MRRPLRIMAAGLAVLAVASCSNGGEGGAGVQELGASTSIDRASVIATLTDTVFVPGYEALASTSRDLVDAIDALCATPAAASLTAAQTAWDAAADAWRATEAYRFGPADTQRAMAAIAFTIDPAKLDALLTESTAPLTAGEIAALGADVRGLNGIEYVLFAPGGASALDARECSYLTGTSGLVAAAASTVRDAWTSGDPPFAEQMKQPGSGGMYANEQEVVNDLVNGSIAALTAAADARLGRASGDVTGTPAAAEVDAGRAHRALDDVAAILASVRQVYGDEGSAGLGEMVAGQSAGADQRVRRQLADAVTDVEAIPAPLASVQGDDLGRVKTAFEQVRAARTTFRTEVASLLGATVSFSDSDGDS